MDKDIEDFVTESNRIEGIQGVRPGELEAHDKFLAMPELTVANLIELVSVLQPDAVLRKKPGQNVRIGAYYPPSGGPEIRRKLEAMLEQINKREINAYDAHLAYEALHPFTDGNGRSGRAIWLWQMRFSQIGFLHAFYYQTLRACSVQH